MEDNYVENLENKIAECHFNITNLRNILDSINESDNEDISIKIKLKKYAYDFIYTEKHKLKYKKYTIQQIVIAAIEEQRKIMNECIDKEIEFAKQKENPLEQLEYKIHAYNKKIMDIHNRLNNKFHLSVTTDFTTMIKWVLYIKFENPNIYFDNKNIAILRSEIDTLEDLENYLKKHDGFEY